MTNKKKTPRRDKRPGDFEYEGEDDVNMAALIRHAAEKLDLNID